MAKVERSKILHRKQKALRTRRRLRVSCRRPRLSVFRSLRGIYGQIIDDETGRTVVSASSLDKDLRDSLKGLKKTEAAAKVGSLLAERAAVSGVAEVVFDRGPYKYHGRVKALADAARAAGLKF